jgi:hypothetical protein
MDVEPRGLVIVQEEVEIQKEPLVRNDHYGKRNVRISRSLQGQLERAARENL